MQGEDHDDLLVFIFNHQSGMYLLYMYLINIYAESKTMMTLFRY